MGSKSSFRILCGSIVSHFMKISHKQKTYFGIVTVFVLSLGLFHWLPDGGLIQNVAAIPVVGSLLGALFQILRDQAAHDRKLAIVNVQNGFTLGATSHMANVAFDKHVLFSEEYVAEVHKAVSTLFREGPTPEVLTHTAALYTLQQKYAVWLTPKIEEDLECFDSALRRIGANAGYVNSATGAEDRPQRIASMFKTFADVMGTKFMGASEWEGESLSEELAVSMVIRKLRAILGIEELTQMRVAFVTNALRDLCSNG